MRQRCYYQSGLTAPTQTKQIMSNATFHNFTDKDFTGYWDGKPKTFKPGDRQYMPAWLAEHFAKHLANRVLIESGKEVYTSPKFPVQVPEFMEVFKKAFIPDTAVGSQEGDLDEIIASANAEPSMDIVVEKKKNIDTGAGAHVTAEAIAAEATEGFTTDQIISTPDDGDESEYEVEGK